MAFDGVGQRQAVLQRLVLEAPRRLRDLYWRPEPGIHPGAAGLVVEAGATASFHTYFGAFYEQHWRAGTRLNRIGLRLDLEGQGWLRMMRHTQHLGTETVYEGPVAGRSDTLVPDEVGHWRQAGLLWFEVTAGPDGAVLREAAWTAPGATPDPVALGIAICTFNRENELAAVLAAVAANPALTAAVARIVVVNQGRPGLAGHAEIAQLVADLGPRLRIVEQANFGGAGGFGRGLLELLDDPDTTHAVFLDDDVRLEPESLARMHAFFSFADADCALGGHMLDAMNPAMLYEAGATIGPSWWMQPIAHMQDVRSGAVLNSLLELGPMHYNGWWCFGFPKRLVDAHGMMLPCFIRGDDVEFGLRLHQRGVPTFGLPGVAIWHEPFYLKLGGWQIYYETRNMLTWSALHLGWTRGRAAARLLSHFLLHLLTYRYYSAALIVRGIEDWNLGPAILDRDPRPLHAALAAWRARYPEPSTPRTRALQPATVGANPRLPWLAMTRVLARNLLKPTPDAEPRVLDVQDLVWYRVAPNEAVAIENHWDPAMATFRRDRAAFRTLGRAGLRAIWTLYRRAPALQRAWQDAAPRLTSLPFWRDYIAMPPGVRGDACRGEDC